MKRTPWFSPQQKPVRDGLYEAQDKSMRCNCCWMTLEWRKGEWFSRTNIGGQPVYATHYFLSRMRRWRGVMKGEQA